MPIIRHLSPSDDLLRSRAMWNKNKTTVQNNLEFLLDEASNDFNKSRDACGAYFIRHNREQAMLNYSSHYQNDFKNYIRGYIYRGA